MGLSNIRDLLPTFSPALDFFAISSGDGRIKVIITWLLKRLEKRMDLKESEAFNLFLYCQSPRVQIENLIL